MPLVSESLAVHSGNVMPLLAESACRRSGICKIRYDRRRSKTKKNGVGIKPGTIFGSIFPDFGGSTLAISAAQFTPTQLALSDRRIQK